MTERRSPRADLVRLPDWESRLAKVANDWKHRPYVYGVSDCGQFALAAVTAVTGAVLLDDIVWPRGWLGVAKVMLANGWDSVEATMDDILPRSAIRWPRRGDIVSFGDQEELHLGVRVGDVALSQGVGGLVTIAPARWLRAWAVG